MFSWKHLLNIYKIAKGMKAMLDMFFIMKWFINSIQKMFQYTENNLSKTFFKPIFSECLLNLHFQTCPNKDGCEQ